MEISIKNESQRFLQFLEEENNTNIIFSGIYGIGKSYFINDFSIINTLKNIYQSFLRL